MYSEITVSDLGVYAHVCASSCLRGDSGTTCSKVAYKQ